MLDDFREQADTSFTEEEDAENVLEASAEQQHSSGRLLGLTPAQRFVIAIMLLALTCMVGSLCLLVTGRVALPFLF